MELVTMIAGELQHPVTSNWKQPKSTSKDLLQFRLVSRLFWQCAMCHTFLRVKLVISPYDYSRSHYAFKAFLDSGPHSPFTERIEAFSLKSEDRTLEVFTEELFDVLERLCSLRYLRLANIICPYPQNYPKTRLSLHELRLDNVLFQSRQFQHLFKSVDLLRISGGRTFIVENGESTVEGLGSKKLATIIRGLALPLNRSSSISQVLANLSVWTANPWEY